MGLFSRYSTDYAYHYPGDDEETTSQSSDPSDSDANPSEGVSPFVFYATLLVFLCAITNALVGSSRPLKYNTLRRPNQFPGLERIVRSNVVPMNRSIINLPFVVALVDKQDPRRGIESRMMGGERLAYKVEVTNTTKTVLQFRTLDWGMELCELTIRTGAASSPLPFHQFTSAFALEGEIPSRIRIFRDSSPSQAVLLPKQISYTSAPTIGIEMGSVILDHGIEWGSKFWCEMDTLHTISLVGINGTAEWWQGKQADSPAVFLRQYPTK